MKILVLCVDRDDDIGVKTGIKAPLVGREDNLAAATKLGLADPEALEVIRRNGAATAERVRRDPAVFAELLCGPAGGL